MEIKIYQNPEDFFSIMEKNIRFFIWISEPYLINCYYCCNAGSTINNSSIGESQYLLISGLRERKGYWTQRSAVFCCNVYCYSSAFFLCLYCRGGHRNIYHTCMSRRIPLQDGRNIAHLLTK